MTRVVCFGQMKGGTGKSCASINLACAAVASGETAAIVDMDTEQGTSLKWGKRRGGAAPIVHSVDASRLAGVLKRLRTDGVRWVFIDLPGRSAPSASAGLSAADLIIVPCRPLEVDIEASAATVQQVMRGGKRYAYLLNIVQPQHEKKRAKQVAAALQAAGHPVIPGLIIQRSDVPDAIGAGKGVNEFDPAGRSASEFAQLFQWLKDNVS